MSCRLENCRAVDPLRFNPPRLRDPSFSNCCDIALSRPSFCGGAGWDDDDCSDEVWATLREEAWADAQEEPILRHYYACAVLSHGSLESALSTHLASKLSVPDLLPSGILQELFLTTFAKYPEIGRAVRADLCAAKDRDAACRKLVHCFLYYKGFLALETHRVAHRLWSEGRAAAALMLQGRASEAFAVDIHPAAGIGSGVLLDHATGIVIGETAVLGDDVSLLHGVTLGGTGKEAGDRHPKLGDGVLVGAGASVLGNVAVGAAAKVGAGAVVLREVPPGATAVGNPARLVGEGRRRETGPVQPDRRPGLTMDQTSWSDYVI